MEGESGDRALSRWEVNYVTASAGCFMQGWRNHGWTVDGDTSWSEEEPVHPVVRRQCHRTASRAVAVKTVDPQGCSSHSADASRFPSVHTL